MDALLATERHYTPSGLAELWGLSPQTIRELFIGEPGVILIGEPSRRDGRTLKRGYFTMRIPESVAVRVHTKLSERTSAKRRV
jgi:hypothetical protein